MIKQIKKEHEIEMQEGPRKKISLDDVSRIVWTRCFGVRFDEKALIITDKQREEIAQSLLGIGKELCKCQIVTIDGMKMHGEEPSEKITKMMFDADVVIAPTTFSLTHTEAALEASGNNTRIITMPGITKEMFLRAIPLDYKSLYQCGENLIEKMSGNEVKIETRAGTDLYLRSDGRKYHNCCGIMQKAEHGKILNLPDGEICIAPLEGKAEGRIVIDTSSAPDSETKFGIIGRVKKPFKISVEGGEMVDCENDVLWKAVTSANHGTNLAELGIGINPKATITGRILEDEKVLGTAHIGFGTNKDMGGIIQTSVHMDTVFMKPTIDIDGERVILEGKF